MIGSWNAWGLYHVVAIQQVLKPQTSTQSLLDVGGGTGYLARVSAERYARVVVADLSPGMLSVARGRKLETVEASALALPFRRRNLMLSCAQMPCTISSRLSALSLKCAACPEARRNPPDP
jgi:SAM-dependent methyltransferase